MKLTNIFIFSIFLFSILAHGQDANINMCEKEAERFGNGLGKDRIPFECVELMRLAAPVAAVKSSADGKVIAFGHRNIVFIKQNDKVSVIAGNYTELEEILGLAIDDVNQEVAVLDQKGDVRFYSSYITGNVAPLRVIKHKDLEGAVDLVIDTKNDEVIVLNKIHRSLVFFSRLANYHGPEKIKRMKILRKIEKLQAFESLSIDTDNQIIMSLDAKKQNQQKHSLKK